MSEYIEPEQGLVDLSEWKASRSGCKRVRLPVPIPLNIERPLDRAMHSAFVQWRGSDDQIPSRGVQKINEGHARPWRHLAKYFVEARLVGVSYARVKDVVRALDWWVDLIYGQATSVRPEDAAPRELARQIHVALGDNDGTPKRAA